MNKKFIIGCAVLSSMLIIGLGCAHVEARNNSSEALQKGIDRANVIIDSCRAAHKSGEIDSFISLAQCGNKAIRNEVLPHSLFPDLVKEYMAYRAEIAQRIDEGKLDAKQGQDLLDKRRSALQSKAEKMRKEQELQDWADDARAQPFKRIGCDFKKSGVGRCTDW